MNRRTLRLDREVLTPLDTDQLADLVGGASVPVVGCEIVPTRLCPPSGHTCIDCLTRYGC